MSPLDPLLRPQRNFANHPDPLAGGLAVFTAHVVGTVLAFVALIHLLLSRVQDLPAGVWSAIITRIVPFILFVVVVAVLSLVLVAWIMHYVAGGNDGDGSLSDATAVAGWAYAPELLALPITYVHAWWRLRDVAFSGSDPSAFSAQAASLTDPTGPFDIVLAFVVVGWSVYILSKGIAGTHDVPPSRTIGAALVIGLFSLLFRLTG